LHEDIWQVFEETKSEQLEGFLQGGTHESAA
jgi:hypothetical protein